jgi:hypothetical protein
MRIYNINDFKRGWFIGNFEPSLLHANFEVAVQKNKAGQPHIDHFHKKGTEYNVVLEGELIINGRKFVKDDVFILEPYEISQVEYITDNTVLVVRDISDPNDKYEVQVL